MADIFLRLFEKLLRWLTPAFIYLAGRRSGITKEQRDAARHAATLARQHAAQLAQIQQNIVHLSAADRLKRLRAKWQSADKP